MGRGAWRAMVCGVTKEPVMTEELSMHTSVHTSVYQYGEHLFPFSLSHFPTRICHILRIWDPTQLGEQ